jgi:tetratricopeptide (TPR) repeat protein
MDNPAHSPKAKPAEKKTLYVKLADFLRKYRIVVIAAFGAAALIVVGVAVGTAIKGAVQAKAAAAIEKLDADFGALSSEQDKDKRAALEKAFLDQAAEVAKKWSGDYAALKALGYQARIAEEKKDWASAEKDWLAVLGAAPGSFLAPVALQSAAVAAEEQGAPDRALADYKKLVNKYASTAVGIPHAYFAIGRLSEQGKDYPAALAAYQKIVSTWPSGDWTKLATDRIISLKANGLAK